MATFCFPNAPGVPGLSGQPPYWLPGGPYPQRTELDDPRWRGAFRRTDANGEVIFRAVYDVESGQKSLYLSWHAPFVPDLDDTNDQLYVGLLPNGGSTAMVIRIQAHTSEVAAVAQPVGPIDVFTKSQAAGVWPAGAWSPVPAEPTWIAQNTHAWITPSVGTSGAYAVQMRVPISTSGSVTNNAGPNLGDEFDVWFFMVGGSGAGPVELAELPDFGTTFLNLADDEYPNPDNGAGWDHVSTVAGDPACPTTGGVALSSVDIGTTNTPASKILFDPDVAVPSRPVNTFFARPRNYTGSTINTGDLTARFRIANWGSIADPTASWVNIPGGGSVASSSNIPAIPAGAAPPATNPINFNWRLDDADITTFITGATPHKCVLVELNGPGLVFFNDSVYRNMNFVDASVFKQEAEINIRGLGPAPGGGAHRDVYLAIEKHQMPSKISPDEQPPDTVPLPPEPSFPDDGDDDDIIIDVAGRGGRSREEPRNVPVEKAISLAKDGQLTEDVIQSFMPTYRVHVYHDTGGRIGGRPVLRPQTYFGYFVEHDGPLTGWRDQLQAPASAQLEEISENFYKIVVPNDGTAKITTVIEAVETDDTSESVLDKLLAWFRTLPRWQQILLIIAIILLFLIVF